MNKLHQTHPGITRMKAMARSYVWWPKFDTHLEDMVKSCTSCQSVKEAPPAAPLHPWIWPTKPWERIHVDFAGPFQNKMFLNVVNAHSKWPEVMQMTSTSAEQTIIVLRQLFASYGLPLQLVSDNGPQFTAIEFQCFLKGNGVKHIRCSPYHPSSNGLVEGFVRTFKQAMKQRRSQTRAYPGSCPGIRLLCPTISSLPSYKNGIQVIKVYIAISYSTKKFPQTSILGPID